MTHNEVRQRGYWIIGGISVVSNLVSKCIFCRKLRALFVLQKLADLPEDRVETITPFTYSALKKLVNSKLFSHLHQIKAQKFEQLRGPPITCDSSLGNLNTVVTIPENLSLSDAEKSVLSKGLNFVPISKKLDEFSVKQDVEKFLRRVQLKAFFHDKEDDSNTSDKDIFETLQTRKSKWTPPEGQCASLDFFYQKMPS